MLSDAGEHAATTSTASEPCGDESAVKAETSRAIRRVSPRRRFVGALRASEGGCPRGRVAAFSPWSHRVLLSPRCARRSALSSDGPDRSRGCIQTFVMAVLGSLRTACHHPLGR